MILQGEKIPVEGGGGVLWWKRWAGYLKLLKSSTAVPSESSDTRRGYLAPRTVSLYSPPPTY